MGKKAFSVLMLVALVIALLPAVASAAPAAAEGKVYTIQKDDWLSKLADKEYGDGSAFWAIYYFNNLSAVGDSTFVYIENPDLIEVGDSLYLPTA